MIRCSYPPDCKQPAVIDYCGRDLCQKHWDKLANSEGEMEQTILGNIGLMRVDGVVRRNATSRTVDLDLDIEIHSVVPTE